MPDFAWLPSARPHRTPPPMPRYLVYPTQSAPWELQLPRPRHVALTSGELARSDGGSRIHPRQLHDDIPGFHFRPSPVKGLLLTVTFPWAQVRGLPHTPHTHTSPRSPIQHPENIFSFFPEALLFESLCSEMRQNSCGPHSESKNAGWGAGAPARVLAGGESPGSRPRLCHRFMIGR